MTMNNRRRLRERVALAQWKHDNPDFFATMKEQEIVKAGKWFSHMSWRDRARLDRQIERNYRKYGDYFG